MSALAVPRPMRGLQRVGFPHEKVQHLIPSSSVLDGTWKLIAALCGTVPSRPHHDSAEGRLFAEEANDPNVKKKRKPLVPWSPRKAEGRICNACAAECRVSGVIVSW